MKRLRRELLVSVIDSTRNGPVRKDEQRGEYVGANGPECSKLVGGHGEDR